MKNFKLSRQLRQAGATSLEARDLAALTTGLNDAVPHLDASVKRQIAQDIGLHQRPVYARPKFALAGAFVALIVLSVLAQFAQPGSPLYALKRATDEVRVILQPSIKADLEHQRQDEQRKADDQQRIEDAPSIRSDGKSGDGGSSDATSGGTGGSGSGGTDGTGGSGSSSQTGSADGSGKGVDIKVNSSGPGSGNITTPVTNNGGGGQSVDGSGSGQSGSSDGGSGDGLKL